VKRVVTGVNADGRSYVVSSEELPEDIRHVWEYDPSHDVRDWVRNVDPATRSIGPESPGGAHWMLVRMPAHMETDYGPLSGFDADGFHTTSTVDFDYVVEGVVTLVLDEGQVELEKGDFLVLHAGRHTWRNDNDEPALLVALLIRPDTAT
jgi:mannose-6-phosphate isomerase-like protein (cupin superfamily)